MRARLMSIVVMFMVSLGVLVALAAAAMGRQAAATESLARASEMRRVQQDIDMLHDTLRADAFAALLLGSRAVIGSAQLAADMGEHSSRLRADLEQLTRLAGDDELAKSIAANREHVEQYIATVGSLLQSAIAGRSVGASEVDELNRSFEQLETALAAQTRLIGFEIERANLSTKREGDQAQQRLLWVAAALALLALAAIWMLAQSVRASVGRVRDAAEAMARGNLDAAAPAVHTDDELGQLARAIDGMAHNLREMIGRLRADADRDAFGTQLVEALEMSDTEPEVHQVIARAMSAVATDRPMELLLADSSRAQLERAAKHETEGAPGCTVESPFSCVAVRRGNPVTFENSEALNACPRLRGRSCGPVSAVCVPVSFMGRALGVLHTTGPQGQLPAAEQIAQLTTLGIQSGARIGTVRAFERTQIQASTDSLTGLANRRSLDEVVHTLMESGTPYALVMADLDHFKRLNDSFGHEAGDSALRVFADAMRQSVRENDHPARWGGEEFAIVMPGADAAAALGVVDRLRARLAELLLATGGAGFTASFGIADSNMSRLFEQQVRIADDALYRSKEEGRDRATIGDPLYVQGAVPRRDTEQRAGINMKAMAAAAG